ncbi:MAG: elongation factor P [Deltaproteobacteria bacterium]
MLQATQLRVGMKILFNGEPHLVMTIQHHTPGNLRGMVHVKMRNLKSGRSLEHRFSSSDKVERVVLETIELEYMYSGNGQHHFMNTENYEQVAIDDESMGGMKFYLLPNVKFAVEFYEGRPVGVTPPRTIELKVVDTQPNMRGATVTASQKPATLETGLVVNVPQFIEVGEVLRIDTEEGKYIERAK